MKEQGVCMGQWREVDFEENCTYIVKDHTVEPSNQASLPRARTSIPRNLTFKYSGNLTEVVGVLSREYIPQGTRFGPLLGEIYTKDNVPKNTNRKYFWRILPDLLSVYSGFCFGFGFPASAVFLQYF